MSSDFIKAMLASNGALVINCFEDENGAIRGATPKDQANLDLCAAANDGRVPLVILRPREVNKNVV
jgi:hypothetical protein